MKKRYYIFLFLGIASLIFFGCEKEWDEHYDNYPETVNKNVWDELKNDQRVSAFLKLLEQSQYDTLFNSDIAYTLFIPGNDVLESYLNQNDLTDYYLGYHISSHYIQSGNIPQNDRLVQTINDKYIHLQRQGGSVYADEVAAEFESPLYMNGKYFILEEVIEPLPSLYQYFKVSNPVLSEYIDTQDSIVIDTELSRPIGFDEEGRTVYDTVSNIVNKFELEYFPVKQEDRKVTGTVVFPKVEDYNNALNEVADAFGSSFVDYRDIPLDWQYEKLMPLLFRQGVFLNKIEPEEFVWKSEKDTAKVLNILGDSVAINYTPTDKTLCSNGYAYNYSNFTIPDSLYLGATRFEAETLLEETGINRHAWNEDVKVESDIAVLPQQIFINAASNDSIIRVDFPTGYEGKYSVQFKGPKLLPRRYVMAVETHMDIGGIYDIYVNDELATTFDYYEFKKFRGLIYSVTGDRYFPRGRYNKFDMYVENVTSYEKVDIRFEYKGPGSASSNGLVIDYIEFIPASN